MLGFCSDNHWHPSNGLPGPPPSTPQPTTTPGPPTAQPVDIIFTQKYNWLRVDYRISYDKQQSFHSRTLLVHQQFANVKFSCYISKMNNKKCMLLFHLLGYELPRMIRTVPFLTVIEINGNVITL